MVGWTRPEEAVPAIVEELIHAEQLALRADGRETYSGHRC